MVRYRKHKMWYNVTSNTGIIVNKTFKGKCKTISKDIADGKGVQIQHETFTRT